jgi:hypothetical protein
MSAVFNTKKDEVSAAAEAQCMKGRGVLSTKTVRAKGGNVADATENRNCRVSRTRLMEEEERNECRWLMKARD